MILYYKHTNGESFTKNNENYTGFFHILSGVAYSGKYNTTNSEILAPTDTFISDVHNNLFEFDSNYKNISNITASYTNAFDLLNNQGLNDLISNLDDNNTICFKNLIISNPTIFNFQENDGFFYGLSSLLEETPQSIPIKNKYGEILPYSESINYSFMDNIQTGTFLVNTRDEFKYLCSDDIATYILKGDFNGLSPLVVQSVIPNSPYYDETHLIYNDTESSKLLFVKNDKIEIYDASNYDECDNLILVDEINLLPTSTQEFIWDKVDISFGEMAYPFSLKYSTDNPNNPKFIKFGYNKRTSLKDGNLILLNKYSTDIIQTINLNSYNLGDIIDLDIRNTDDAIIILNRKSDGLYVCFFDSSDLATLWNKPIYSIEDSLEIQNIQFSEYDSNIFVTYNEKEYQTRYLSNVSYPSGRLETNDLYYLRDYKWNSTDEMFNFVNITWDSSNIESNKYNNLTISNYIKNNKMYMLLHNIGRLYVMQQPIVERYKNFIPFDLTKYYNGITCSESSIGIYLNSIFSNILKDTLNLFAKSSSSYTFEERQVISRQIQDLEFQTLNFYINGNESINVTALQRIIILMTDIQRKLIPTT